MVVTTWGFTHYICTLQHYSLVKIVYFCHLYIHNFRRWEVVWHQSAQVIQCTRGKSWNRHEYCNEFHWSSTSLWIYHYACIALLIHALLHVRWTMHHFKLSQHHMVVWIFCIEEFIMLVTLNITITFKTSIEVLYILRYLILSHWKKLPWSIKTFKQTAWIDEFNHYQTSLCIHIWKNKGQYTRQLSMSQFTWNFITYYMDQEMCVSSAKQHGTTKKSVTTKKCDYWTDRQKPNKVIPMCRYVFQAAQKPELCYLM